MNCSLCGNALSGFVAGLGALVTFILFPVIEVMLTLFGLIINKIVAKEK